MGRQYDHELAELESPGGHASRWRRFPAAWVCLTKRCRPASSPEISLPKSASQACGPANGDGLMMSYPLADDEEIRGTVVNRGTRSIRMAGSLAHLFFNICGCSIAVRSSNALWHGWLFPAHPGFIERIIVIMLFLRMMEGKRLLHNYAKSLLLIHLYDDSTTKTDRFGRPDGVRCASLSNVALSAASRRRRCSHTQVKNRNPAPCACAPVCDL